jgi:hypothetical protein
LRLLLPRRGVQATAALLRRSQESVYRKGMELLKVPPRRGAWTDSDEARLRESWGVLELRLLAAMLGRPAADVQQRVSQLRQRVASGPWAHEQIQALKDLYGTRQDEDLEVALLRAKEDIATMARQLCLAKDKRLRPSAAHRSAAKTAMSASGPVPPETQRRMPRWSASEVERLRALYPTLENLEVARQLGRTVTSVANKAHQLQLKKSTVLLAQIGRTNVSLRYRGAAAVAPAALPSAPSPAPLPSPSTPAVAVGVGEAAALPAPLAET